MSVSTQSYNNTTNSLPNTELSIRSLVIRTAGRTLTPPNQPVSREAVIKTARKEGATTTVPEISQFTVPESGEPLSYTDPQPLDETDTGVDPEPEPLDTGVEDHYGLHEPIADSKDGIQEWYLDDGDVPTAYECNGSYYGKLAADKQGSDRDGWTNTIGKFHRVRYTQLLEGDRRIQQQYDELTTALISLRLRPTYCKKRGEQLKEYMRLIPQLTQKLRYYLTQSTNGPQLDSSSYAYAYTLAGTDTKASIHMHMMVYVDSKVSKDVFQPVVDTWVTECQYTDSDGTGNKPNQGAVSVYQGSDIPTVDNGSETAGIVYLASQLVGLGDESQLDNVLFYSTVRAYGESGYGKSANWPINQAESKEILKLLAKQY